MDVAWNGKYFFIVSQSTTVIRSIDGINWGTATGASALMTAPGSDAAAIASMNILPFTNYIAAGSQGNTNAIVIGAASGSVALSADQIGTVYIFTSGTSVTFTTALLGASNVGFYVQLKNTTASNITVNSFTLSSTTSVGINPPICILYWSGSALSLY